MKALENLLHTEFVRPRGIGYTTVMAEAAKKLNGTLVVHNMGEAKRVKHEHGVKAVTVDSEWRGTKGPYIWDSTAFLRAASDAERLEKENENLRKLLKKHGISIV